MAFNCRNCGAPVEDDQIRCPYCKTLYLDMTVEQGKPFYLRFKTKYGKIIFSKMAIKSINVEFNSRIDTRIYADDTEVAYIGHEEGTVNIKLGMLEDKAGVLAYTYDEEAAKNEPYI